MLTAIGILISLSQFHVMLDREIPGDGIDNLRGIPGAIWSTITEHNELNIGPPRSLPDRAEMRTSF